MKLEGSESGLTLLELLVVLVLVAILAALLLPAFGRAGVQSKVQQARIEMSQIVMAVSEYESLYGHFPVSDEALRAAKATGEDMTYGGVMEETQEWLAGPGPYQTNNAEVMAPLLDLENYGDGAPTINHSHVKNPKANKLLDPKMPGGTNAAPGVGMDGVYRDPWGSPYVITLDLNGDGHARDFFYREPAVSADVRSPERGLNGLVRNVDAHGAMWFDATAPVTVWSAGPDRHFNMKDKANRGFNRDNILSWNK